MRVTLSSNLGLREAEVPGSPARRAGASAFRVQPSCSLAERATGPDLLGGSPTEPWRRPGQPRGLRAVHGSAALPRPLVPASAALQTRLQIALPAAAAPLVFAPRPLWFRRSRCAHLISSISLPPCPPPPLWCPYLVRGSLRPPERCGPPATPFAADC